MKDRLREARKTVGLSQKDFANQIGMPQASYANYELGRVNPSSSAINNICKTFGVNEKWLRTGEGEMFIDKNDEVTEMMHQLQMDEEARGMVEAFLSVPKDAREAFAYFAKKYIRAYVEQFNKKESYATDVGENEPDQWGCTAEDYHRVQSIEDEMKLEKEKREKSGA